MHPAVYLVAWLVLLLLSSVLEGHWLVLGIGLCLLRGRAARTHWWRLLWRTKILLLTLAVLIAYSVPGVLLGGHAWAPSQEGLSMAAEQVLRLILILGALALLLTGLPRERLMLALWSLLQWLLPAAWATRSVARLALVLRYVEDEPKMDGWRAFLRDETVAQAETMRLPHAPWRYRDFAALLVLMIPLCFAWVLR